MKKIENKEEIEKIIEYNKRIKIKELFALNTPWAKDEKGERDTTNLALFVEFVDRKTGEEFGGYWLVSEPELKQLLDDFLEVSLHNRNYNNKGLRYKKELFEKIKKKEDSNANKKRG